MWVLGRHTVMSALPPPLLSVNAWDHNAALWFPPLALGLLDLGLWSLALAVLSNKLRSGSNVVLRGKWRPNSPKLAAIITGGALAFVPLSGAVSAYRVWQQQAATDAFPPDVAQPL